MQGDEEYLHMSPEQRVMYVVRTGQSQVGAEVLQMYFHGPGQPGHGL